MKKTRLNKREVAQLARMQDIVDKMARNLEESGNNFSMRIEGNGTICDNLSCVAGALEQILQEYF